MNKQKIIFLDIDGVLNSDINKKLRKRKNEPTSSYFITIPGDKIYRLKRIVDSTNASVVISSSWRIGFKSATLEPSKSYMNIYNQLTPYGINIIGWTPLHRDRHRGTEIQWWLNEFQRINKYTPNYIIIDDNIDDIIDMHRGHCVKTTSLLGLQDVHVNIAINLLNRYS